jgi:hypothetical protein
VARTTRRDRGTGECLSGEARPRRDERAAVLEDLPEPALALLGLRRSGRPAAGRARQTPA